MRPSTQQRTNGLRFSHESTRPETFRGCCPARPRFYAPATPASQPPSKALLVIAAVQLDTLRVLPGAARVLTVAAVAQLEEVIGRRLGGLVWWRAEPFGVAIGGDGGHSSPVPPVLLEAGRGIPSR